MRLTQLVVPFIHPLLWSTEIQLRRSVWNRIFCSPEFAFIYFRIPKSANSTVALTLAQCMGSGLSPADDMTGARSKDFGNRFLESKIFFPHQLDRYFTFTFVRNPFTRVLSAYLDKVATRTAKFQKALGLNDEEVSFSRFLERLNDGYLMKNVHWAPQVALLPVEPRRLSFLGHVENIDTDTPEDSNRII